MLFVILLSCVL